MFVLCFFFVCFYILWSPFTAIGLDLTATLFSAETPELFCELKILPSSHRHREEYIGWIILEQWNIALRQPRDPQARRKVRFSLFDICYNLEGTSVPECNTYRLRGVTADCYEKF